jgi:hypothetical protein
VPATAECREPASSIGSRSIGVSLQPAIPLEGSVWARPDRPWPLMVNQRIEEVSSILFIRLYKTNNNRVTAVVTKARKSPCQSSRGLSTETFFPTSMSVGSATTRDYREFTDSPSCAHTRRVVRGYIGATTNAYHWISHCWLTLLELQAEITTSTKLLPLGRGWRSRHLPLGGLMIWPESA